MKNLMSSIDKINTVAGLGFVAESLWDSSEISARLAQILAALDILVRSRTSVNPEADRNVQCR